jgi:hypothetical protein
LLRAVVVELALQTQAFLPVAAQQVGLELHQVLLRPQQLITQ